MFDSMMDPKLIKLAQEDPSFHFSRDEEVNQTVIEGMGELHLEIIVDRLKREYKVSALYASVGKLLVVLPLSSVKYLCVLISLSLSHTHAHTRAHRPNSPSRGGRGKHHTWL